MNKIAQELVITNQRLNEVKDIPIGNIEEKITKQVELVINYLFDFRRGFFFIVRRKISKYDQSTIGLAGSGKKDFDFTNT
jgi:hypothetical protein